MKTSGMRPEPTTRARRGSEVRAHGAQPGHERQAEEGEDGVVHPGRHVRWCTRLRVRYTPESGACQPLVRDAVGTVGLGAELGAAVLLVRLEVAFEPRHLRVALEREHVRGDA